MNVEFDKKYDIASYCYNGVMMNRKLAIKMYRLLAKHQEEIYQLLIDNIDDLNSSNWTIAYPELDQITVKYIDPNETREEKISRLRVFKLKERIKKHDLVIHAKNNKKAEFRFLKRIGKTDRLGHRPKKVIR